MGVITRATAVAATAATAAVIGSASMPIAGADNYPVIQKFGTQEQLVDGAGTIVQDWTVTYLQPSSDVVPWPVHGKLWEANATVRAIRGTVTPIIPDLNARAANGQTYQALAVPTPRGINPSTLGQGGQATGKLYFDVVGPPPNGIVYNVGGRDLLFWVR